MVLFFNNYIVSEMESLCASKLKIFQEYNRQRSYRLRALLNKLMEKN